MIGHTSEPCAREGIHPPHANDVGVGMPGADQNDVVLG